MLLLFSAVGLYQCNPMYIEHPIIQIYECFSRQPSARKQFRIRNVLKTTTKTLLTFSSFGSLALLFLQDESDEYVSPDEQDPENDVDYETPNEDGSMEDVNDADYEPPPSNDDMHRHTIFPSKSIPNTSEYLGNLICFLECHLYR